MPAADYERAMLKVRAHVASKSSHGRDELLREIARIESECELEEPDSLYDTRPRPLSHPADRAEHDGDGARKNGATAHDDVEPLATTALMSLRDV